MIVFNFTHFRRYNLKTIDKILVRYQMSLKNGIPDSTTLYSQPCIVCFEFAKDEIQRYLFFTNFGFFID